MKDEKSVPRNDDSSSKASAEARGMSESESKPAAEKSGSENESHTAPLTADEIVSSAHQALNMESGGMDPSSPSGKPRKKKKHPFSIGGIRTKMRIPSLKTIFTMACS